ncbi:MAG TPA: carbonic anhydrase [Pirellulales bacterium]
MDLIYRYDPFQPIVVNRPTNADEAIQALVEGNRRLVELVGHMQNATLGDPVTGEIVVPISPISMGLPFFSGGVLDQEPFAMFLGCSDARVPIESIFDTSFNELFVVRMAGNGLSTEGIGSFTYGVRNFTKSVKVLTVLGHTGCGAVTAAVNTYLAPNEYANIGFTHALRTLVDRIMIGVRGAAKSIERSCGRDVTKHPNYRAVLLDVSVYLNAAITALDLQRELGAISNDTPPVYYGVCDLKTLLVTSAPVHGTSRVPDLRRAPHDATAFVELGKELVEVLVANGALA